MLVESNRFESTADLHTRFSKDGYLYFRGFFPNDLIQKVREVVIKVLAQEGWGKEEDGIFKPQEPAIRINSPPFHQCISRMMKEEVLHELGHYPVLSEFLGSLLGEPVYAHPRKMLRITYPYAMNPMDRTPPHQDLFYVKGERDTFTCWIPLGEYPPEQGGLQLAAGTHKNGLYPTKANEEGRFGCTAITDSEKGFIWYSGHYKPGDLLLMHSLTIHQSGVNETKQFRLSLDCRFSSAKGCINEDQLLPPYSPHVPAWAALSTDWKNKERFQPPTTLQIHSKDKPHAEVLQTQSRFA